MIELRLKRENPTPETIVKIGAKCGFRKLFDNNSKFIFIKESSRFVYYTLPYNVSESGKYIESIVNGK